MLCSCLMKLLFMVHSRGSFWLKPDAIVLLMQCSAISVVFDFISVLCCDVQNVVCNVLANVDSREIGLYEVAMLLSLFGFGSNDNKNTLVVVIYSSSSVSRERFITIRSNVQLSSSPLKHLTTSSNNNTICLGFVHKSKTVSCASV